jgi:hypothetical protein
MVAVQPEIWLWALITTTTTNNNNKQHSQETSMPSAGFEQAIPTSKRPQTQA